MQNVAPGCEVRCLFLGDRCVPSSDINYDTVKYLAETYYVPTRDPKRFCDIFGLLLYYHTEKKKRAIGDSDDDERNNVQQVLNMSSEFFFDNDSLNQSRECTFSKAYIEDSFGVTFWKGRLRDGNTITISSNSRAKDGVLSAFQAAKNFDIAQYIRACTVMKPQRRRPSGVSLVSSDTSDATTNLSAGSTDEMIVELALPAGASEVPLLTSSSSGDGGPSWISGISDVVTSRWQHFLHAALIAPVADTDDKMVVLVECTGRSPHADDYLMHHGELMNTIISIVFW